MIYAIIWFALLVAIYIGTYLANRHTKKPEGCEDFKACAGCHNFMCANHQEGEKS